MILDFVNLNWLEGSHHGCRELSLAVVIPPVALTWPPVILAWPPVALTWPPIVLTWLPVVLAWPSSSSPAHHDLAHRPRLAVVISGLDFVNLALTSRTRPGRHDLWPSQSQPGRCELGLDFANSNFTNSAWPLRTQPGRCELGLAVVISSCCKLSLAIANSAWPSQTQPGHVISSHREFGLAIVISGHRNLCLPIAISGLHDLALAVMISDKAIRAGRVVVLLNFELYM